MYDREWARRILSTYKKSCPRAEQIDLCIIQLMASENLSYTFSRHQIEVGLVRAIRDRHYGKIWNLYKRVTRVTPFNVDLCRLLTRQLYMVYSMEREDAQQILLELDFLDQNA